MSSAVINRLFATPAVWLIEFEPPTVVTSFVAAAAFTASVKLPVPDELMMLSVTLTTAVSASYSVITPLLFPATVGTPLVNVIAVAEPKTTAVPLLLVTVGLVAGLDEACAPEKVRFLPPA